MRQRLPDPLVPTAWIVLDQLPLSPNGKVARNELPDWNGARNEQPLAHTDAETDTERLLARAIEAELQIERIGVTENFFEAGATSLTLVRLNNRLRTQANIDVPIVAMFRHPTVQSLARSIASAGSGPEQPQTDAGGAGARREARVRRRRRTPAD